MAIRILLIDDDLHARQALRKQLSSFSFLQIVGEADSGEAALACLREGQIDLLFLDIEMQGMDGLNVAAHIQAIYSEISIIFVTGHPGFALDGYAHHPLDFLTKPVDNFRLEKTMKHVQQHFSQQKKKHTADYKVGLKTAGGMRIVLVKEIQYIEKRGRKVWIVEQTGETFPTSDSLKKIEEIFFPFGFYRTHQSFLLSLNHIKAVFPEAISRSYTIELKDGKQLPLSRNKLKELKGVLEAEGILIPE